jgi:hypothetical protein
MKTFATSNLGLAAYLLASKRLKLIGIETSNPNQADFVFDDPGGGGEAIDTLSSALVTRLCLRSAFTARCAVSDI